jgi:hypothetical protein
VKADFRCNVSQDIPAYTRIRTLINPSTGTKLSIPYKRNSKLIAPSRAELTANDTTGISVTELRKVIAAFGGDHKLALIEMAFDFDPSSGVDQEFVQRHGFFGRSKPEQNPKYPGLWRYGNRNSSRFVRCYWKEEINAYRVEIELRSRRLRESKNADRTFNRLRSLDIFPEDLCFLRLNADLLAASLRRCGRPVDRIVRTVGELSDLHRKLSYLRTVGIRNPDRFLRPLKLNVEVARAWREWIKELSFKRETEQI